LRAAGAGARAMLVQAAAKQWQVDPASRTASKSEVTHKETGRKLTYGELASAAGSETPPKDVPLKKVEDFIYIGGTLRLLLIAGIDTTWSMIGASLWHLATHEDDRKRLAEKPDLIPTAIEEFLRACAPVVVGREIVKETEIGRRLRDGEMVMLAFGAANRDPAMFPDADRVIIDRTENRHAAFGLGIHRCVGSNLARMEIRIALEEWLGQFPDFILSAGAVVKWSAGTVRGPRQIPVTLRN
jgi:cytochrome P450